MASPPPTVGRSGSRRFSAGQLLIALVLLFVVTPLVEEWKNGDVIEAILVTMVLVSAVLAVGARRRTLVIATTLVIPAIAGKWLNHLRPDLLPPAAFLTLGLVFITFVVVHLLIFILRAKQVSSEVLYVGIATYLMLGLLWVFLYVLVGQLNPKAFAFNVTSPIRQTMTGFNAFYFSFTTLSTAGYGDITPISNEARMLAVLEMMTGVLYVAVLISRLVALHALPVPTGDQDRPDKP